MSDTQEKLRRICTNYSELGEGTASYALTDEQFRQVEALIDSAKREGKKEAIEIVVDKFKQAGLISGNGADMVLNQMRKLIEQSEESK